MKNITWFLFFIFLFMSCEGQYTSSKQYAGIFAPLDGKWEGQFIVYTDSLGQREGNVQPKDIDESSLKKLTLIEELRIDVVQTYASESPYFQRVKIEDTYTEANGSKRLVESHGSNAVKGGKLVCIVNKPDEQVIHQGKSESENVIIWERSLKNPTKIEYFYEKVDEQFYSIIGWGYYGDDNPKLSPKTWFYAKYKRIE